MKIHMTVRSLLTAPLLATALLFAANAGAQAPTPTAAPPAATPPAAVSPSPSPLAETLATPVTPETRAAIKELLDITHVRESLKRTYLSMGQSLPQQMAQAMNRSIEDNASLSAEQKQQVRERMNKSFEGAVKEAMQIVQDPKVVDDTLEKVYPIYAKAFTPAEIRQITAFYKTPIGGKVITTMPQVFNDTLVVGFSVFQPRLNAVMDKTLKTEIAAVQKK